MNWENVKHTNIHIIRVQKEKERERWFENLFERIMMKNSHNLLKKTGSPKQNEPKDSYNTWTYHNKMPKEREINLKEAK